MSRLLAIAWAKLRCHAYLLFWGMWRGECALTGYHDPTGRICLIAAVRPGSRWIRRLFYVESNHPGWPNPSIHT